MPSCPSEHIKPEDLLVETLGECRFPSPLGAKYFVNDEDRISLTPYMRKLTDRIGRNETMPSFEPAGPRERIFFKPSEVTAGIVTCGGLCPGLNDVIRAIVIALERNYRVPRILGFRYGYAGLARSGGFEPMILNREVVDDIHQDGGTILGSSRGPREASEMVDRLVEEGVDMLFTVGGDGTLRGAQTIVDEIRRRGLSIAVVGVPKTIDNDIDLISKSFGFETAVTMSRSAIVAAHTEAKGAQRGIGLVKLMGRQSGFIAAAATLAHSEVNVCLVPEVDFRIDGEGGLIEYLERRLQNRRHAVVVVAEGAGQKYLEDGSGADETDLSGNLKLKDIGMYLAEVLKNRFGSGPLTARVSYIDPSYIIRSMPATVGDSAFCLQLGHFAVHAAMAGKTGLVVGSWADHFTHVPIRAAVGRRKKIDPDDLLWQNVMQATGQPPMNP
ncbi:MAG TPA: ATP-dependent 6-phosphofructokinase [Myxococcota bacterium]|nr:ATP-dependent 6-phosphofructokinase [Myxococcota bacterium]HPV03973.1 ATP-dependent 6-phosphofructokinase [Myxococcota bacterium]